MSLSERWPKGYTKVWMLENGAAILPRSSYEDLTMAIRRGDPFWEGEDAYGDTVFFVLKTIVQVMDCSPLGLARYKEEEAARKLEDGAE